VRTDASPDKSLIAEFKPPRAELASRENTSRIDVFPMPFLPIRTERGAQWELNVAQPSKPLDRKLLETTSRLLTVDHLSLGYLAASVWHQSAALASKAQHAKGVM
jgi:hypothetical protein